MNVQRRDCKNYKPVDKDSGKCKCDELDYEFCPTLEQQSCAHYSQPRISVVMASNLGNYDKSAYDKIPKFIRAVDSFLSQDYLNKELIIVSDGCNLTLDAVYKQYIDMDLLDTVIKLYKIKKQPLFSGNVREYGLKKATGDIICYLDTDDMFSEKSHLTNIVQQFDLFNHDWVYYNDYIMTNSNAKIVKNVKLEKGSVGTSSVAHLNLKKTVFRKKTKAISWKGCDAYNHDWTFVERLMKQFPRYKKIYGTSYLIRHIPDAVDN